MTTAEAVKARWKAFVVAAAGLAVAFGVELPEGTAEQAVELGGMVAAGIFGLYALGRVVWNRIQGQKKVKENVR